LHLACGDGAHLGNKIKFAARRDKSLGAAVFGRRRPREMLIYAIVALLGAGRRLRRLQSDEKFSGRFAVLRRPNTNEPRQPLMAELFRPGRWR
jgi:hypothetical protein